MKSKKLLPSVVLMGAFAMISGCSTVEEEKTFSNDWNNVCSAEVDLRQSGRVSLDLTRYGKDHFNQTTFTLPVACGDLETLADDEQIVKEQRWGSVLTEFSFSKWDMKVAGKNPVPTTDDDTSCELELTLRERHTGIAPLVFLKDKLNKESFNWNVPCSVYEQVEEGHNFVSDPWRKGSMGKRMVTDDTGYAAGIWSVEVTKKLMPVAPVQNRPSTSALN